ncbi:tyrosine-type recombinase/integrase [Streptomyces sp. RB6PN25]|uniref:Tyrosine-type recombinase/integrase n=1 Tax=Streptomyces humicola TaxID=2953240 RepID=A0ABT1Q274_9ACTN|nr:tyrosine-type recombinase/integrase [Streptomyces humicola]MCQ4084030.1 tyrosine-type recombinase/integrase [Streptomyces humicola]
MALLLRTARDHHQPAAYWPRAYALLLVLYALCLCVDSLLAAGVDDLGYEKGHRDLDVRLKGGARKPKPVPPYVYYALIVCLNGRTEGFLFCTASGRQLDTPAVWRLIRSVAKRAGLPQVDSIHPHVMKHGAITHALGRPIARIDKIQQWADHRTPGPRSGTTAARSLLDDSPGYDLAASIAGAIDSVID